jgi:hypothetical protein
MGQSKILLVNSGINTTKAFLDITGFRFHTTTAADFQTYNLYGYDAIIVLTTGDTTAIAKHTERLMAFVQNGGILVCFGAVGYDRQWIPFFSWDNQLTPNIGQPNLEDEDGALILRGVDLTTLKFHDFFAHGTLSITPRTKILVTTDRGPVMCLVDQDIKGAALITTMDPDRHLAFGAGSLRLGLSLEEQRTLVENANRLIENILKWCVWKLRQRHSRGELILRGIYGYFSIRSAGLVLALLTWTYALWLALQHIVGGQYDTAVIVPGIASLAGLGIVLADKYRGHSD